MTLVLGIESSCDETAAAVVRRDGPPGSAGSAATGARTQILSSVVASQAGLHEPYGGVVPEIASRAHVEKLTPVLERALAGAGVTPGQMNAVAVGHRPGLIGSLLVGVAAAKAIAWSLGVPIIGVDHVQAHLHAALISGEAHAPDGGAAAEAEASPLGGPADAGAGGADATPIFPALGLVVSGGHTALYRVRSEVELTRLGGTIDDAMGEAYDKVAAILGLPYPGGPAVDRLAIEHEHAGASGAAAEEMPALPLPRLGNESLDLSFSGLKTAVLYAARGVPRPKREGGGFPREASEMSLNERRALAAAFQRTACRAVTLKLERAIAAASESDGGGPYRAILAGGGVAANSRLRSELSALARRHRLAHRIPPVELCIDNAAMIAGLGAARLARGRSDDLTLTPVPTAAR